MTGTPALWDSSCRCMLKTQLGGINVSMAGSRYLVRKPESEKTGNGSAVIWFEQWMLSQEAGTGYDPQNEWPMDFRARSPLPRRVT